MEKEILDLAFFPSNRYLTSVPPMGRAFRRRSGFVSFLTNITGIAQLWQIRLRAVGLLQLTFTNEERPRRPM